MILMHKSLQMELEAELARNLQSSTLHRARAMEQFVGMHPVARVQNMLVSLRLSEDGHLWALQGRCSYSITHWTAMINEQGDVITITARGRSSPITVRIRRNARLPMSSPVKLNLGKDKYDEMIKDIEFNGQSADSTCVICQEDFKNKERLKITPCGHIFHPQCISKWLETECIRPTCPSCRHDCREDFSRG